MARSRGESSPPLVWAAGLALVVLAASAGALAQEQQQRGQHEAFHDAAAVSQDMAAGEAGDLRRWLVNPRRDGAAGRSTQLHGVEQEPRHGGEAEQGAVEAMLQHIKRSRLHAALRDFQAAQRLGGLDAEEEAMLAQTEEVLRRLGALASDDANEHALDAQAHQAGVLAQLMNQAHALGQLEDAADAQQELPSLVAHAASADERRQHQQRDAATQTDAAAAGQQDAPLRRPAATTQFDTFVTTEPRPQEGEEPHATLLADMEAARSSDDEGQQVDAAYMSEYDEAAAAAQAHTPSSSSSTGLELAAAQQHQQAGGSLGRLREAQERLASLPWTLLGAQRLEDARDPLALARGEAQQQWEEEREGEEGGGGDAWAGGSVASELDEGEAAALRRDLDNLGDAQSTQDAVAQAATALPELAAHLLRGMMLRHQHLTLGASSSAAHPGDADEAYADDDSLSSSSSASSDFVGDAAAAASDYEQEAAAVRDALLLGPFAFVRHFVESVMGGLGRVAHSRVMVLPGQRLLVLHSRHYDDDDDGIITQADEEQQPAQEGGGRLTLTGASDDPLFSSSGWVGHAASTSAHTHDAATNTVNVDEGEEQLASSLSSSSSRPGGGAWVQPHLWSGGPAHTWHGLMPQQDQDREQQEVAEAERGQDLASLYLSLFHGMRRAEQAAHEQQQEDVLLQRYLEQQQHQVAAGASSSGAAVEPQQQQQQQQQQQAHAERVLPRVPHEWAGLLEADGSINLGALMLAALLMATLFMLVGFVRSLDSLQGAMAACSSSASLSDALVAPGGRGGRWGATEEAEEGGHPLLVPFVVEGSDGALQQGYLWLSEEELRQAAAAAGYQPPVAVAGDTQGDWGKGAAQAAWGAKQADKGEEEVAAEEGGRHVLAMPAVEEAQQGAQVPRREEEEEEGQQGVVFAKNFV